MDRKKAWRGLRNNAAGFWESLGRISPDGSDGRRFCEERARDKRAAIVAAEAEVAQGVESEETAALAVVQQAAELEAYGPGRLERVGWLLSSFWTVTKRGGGWSLGILWGFFGLPLRFADKHPFWTLPILVGIVFWGIRFSVISSGGPTLLAILVAAAWIISAFVFSNELDKSQVSRALRRDRWVMLTLWLSLGLTANFGVTVARANDARTLNPGSDLLCLTQGDLVRQCRLIGPRKLTLFLAVNPFEETIVRTFMNASYVASDVTVVPGEEPNIRYLYEFEVRYQIKSVELVNPVRLPIWGIEGELESLRAGVATAVDRAVPAMSEDPLSLKGSVEMALANFRSRPLFYVVFLGVEQTRSVEVLLDGVWNPVDITEIP